MAEKSDEPSFDDDGEHDQEKKAGFRPSRMVDMERCEDLHRYLVDRFHATKSKAVLFEEIDLSTNKPNAKVVSFKTSEDRLLLWIKTFAIRYYKYLNTVGYRVSWQEQECYSCATKSDKIILHISTADEDNEEQLVTVSVFISTGRIMVQGKRFAEWSSDEFPALLSIVNSLEPLTDNSSMSTDNTTMFLSGLAKFFTACQEEDKEITNRGNASHCIAEIPNEETPKSRQISEPVKPLTLTTSRLHTLSTLRNTVGDLEAEFTQFKISSAGNFDQLKDKSVQQDNLLKVHKSNLEDLCDDLKNYNKLLKDELQNHATLIAKLKDENQTLHKKQTQTITDNAKLKQKQTQLESEVGFLKEQIQALWEKLNLHTSERARMTNTVNQTPPTAAKDENGNSIPTPTAANDEKRNSTPTPPVLQCKEDELRVFNVPTSNSFSVLRETNTDKEDTSKTTTSQRPPVPPSNEVIFLCDSNGKFLDTKQMFPSRHEVKYVRAPLIKHASSSLQNIHAVPHMLLIHTGTNDLERSSPEELISNILTLITEASTKFPSSKILFSTLLPRNDISPSTIISINNQLITSCSKLPNVQLIAHDNLFKNGINILRDNKHILKRHIGLFAKNLKDAIHGRLRPRSTPPLRPVQEPPHNQATPKIPKVMQHASYSHVLQNGSPHAQPWPFYHQMQHPPTPSVREPLQQQIPLAQQRQQQFPATNAAKTIHKESSPSFPETQIPQEIISFLRFVKSFL